MSCEQKQKKHGRQHFIYQRKHEVSKNVFLIPRYFEEFSFLKQSKDHFSFLL